MRMGFAENDLGIGNRLTLLDDELLKNLNDIQLRNGLPPSTYARLGRFHRGDGDRHRQDLRLSAHDLRAEPALRFHQVRHRRALRGHQGGRLQDAPDHRGAFPRPLRQRALRVLPLRLRASSARCATSPPARTSRSWSSRWGRSTRRTSTTSTRTREKTGGEKPIDLIKATRPILIVDEPQSVDGGLEGRGKEALGAMNPLCTLRYSATHVDKHHMVYRLDAVDAYERKLVKQIEVASAAIVGGAQQALRAASRRRATSAASSRARVELDVETAGRVRRQEVTVQDGDRSGTDHRAGTSITTAASAKSVSKRATSSWSCAFPAASTFCASARPSATWTRWRCSGR